VTAKRKPKAPAEPSAPPIGISHVEPPPPPGPVGISTPPVVGPSTPVAAVRRST